MELYTVFRGNYRFMKGEYSEEQQKINGNFNEAYDLAVESLFGHHQNSILWSPAGEPVLAAGCGAAFARGPPAGRRSRQTSPGSGATGAPAAIVDRIASIGTLSSARVSSSSRSRMMRPCWVRYPLKCGALGFLSSSNVIGGVALPCRNFGDFIHPFRTRRVTLGGAGRLRGGTAARRLGFGRIRYPPNCGGRPQDSAWWRLLKGLYRAYERPL